MSLTGTKLYLGLEIYVSSRLYWDVLCNVIQAMYNHDAFITGL